MNRNFNQYVIADIHGCAKTFATLLEKLKLKKSDKLYLLGDYIDRGPDSKGVVDLIINLQKSGYKVFPLHGNHEEDFQFYLTSERRRAAYSRYYPNNNIYDKSYMDFFLSLPYYYELDNHILVHAGFDFSGDDIFKNKEAMLWERDWEDSYVPAMARNKTIVHGHTPTGFDTILRSIEQRQHILPLDNGCVYAGQRELGKLLCLELNSYELQWQECLDLVWA